MNLIHAQIIEPKRLKLGASLGAGGLYTFLSPSFDFHKGGFNARIAAGPFYYGIGLSHHIGYYRGKIRRDRPMFLSINVIDDYLLAGVLNRNQKTPRIDLKAGMLMWTIRANLNHRGTVYCEGGFGAMFAMERIKLDNGNVKKVNHILPMVEFRIGGTFLNRKYYPQKWDDPDKGWFKIKIQIFKKKKKKT